MSPGLIASHLNSPLSIPDADFPLSAKARISSGERWQNALCLIKSFFDGGAQTSTLLVMGNIYYSINSLPMTITLLTGVAIYSSAELLKYGQLRSESNPTFAKWTFGSSQFIKWGLIRPISEFGISWCAINLFIKQLPFNHDSSIEAFTLGTLVPFFNIIPAAALSWLRYQHEEKAYSSRQFGVAYLDIARGMIAPAFTFFLLQQLQWIPSPSIFIYTIMGFASTFGFYAASVYNQSPKDANTIFQVEKIIKTLELVFENTAYASALYLLLDTLFKALNEGTLPATYFYLNITINIFYLMLSTLSTVLDFRILQRGLARESTAFV